MTNPVPPVRVVVVGSLNLDTRLVVADLPRPGQTVTVLHGGRSVGGKGGNQALAAAAAGACTSMVGAVGVDADGDGDAVLEHLTGGGVDVGRVTRTPDTATGEAVVVVAEDGENSILVVAGANGTLDRNHVERALTTLRHGDVVLLQNEIPPQVTAVAARRAAAAGATVVWNVSPCPPDPTPVLRDVDVVLVNEGELDLLATSTGSPPSGIRERATQLSRTTGCAVVCTLGGQGALLARGDDLLHVEAPEVQVVDTTGAGDAFAGYFAASAHLPDEDRLRIAVVAGALAVTAAGASRSVPTLQTVLDLVPVERRPPVKPATTTETPPKEQP